MSYYGGTITVKGRDLITSLIAGETIEFTRIVVGSGEMPEGVEPIDMEDLVNPVAEATSTVPTVENGVLSLVVEYRNDMNGGLKTGFWLREFGIYAKTANSEEVLLYYATLGDSPQPVNAYQDNRIDIRRYPVTIALEVDADIQVTYNPGAFITAEEAEQLVQAMVNESIAEIIGSVGTTIIKDITIPATGWALDPDLDESGEAGEDSYRYRVEVVMAEATADHFRKRGGLLPNGSVSRRCSAVLGKERTCRRYGRNGCIALRRLRREQWRGWGLCAASSDQDPAWRREDRR